MRDIPLEPLTKRAFSQFGEVVELENAVAVEINQGFAARFNRLASIDVGAEQGEVNVSLFIARPRPVPVEVTLMERHPLGSQLFFPLQDRSWIVVTCRDPSDASGYRAFQASGRQGVNYARNIWHSPLLAHGSEARFLCVDRFGPGSNLEEHALEPSRRRRVAI